MPENKKNPNELGALWAKNGAKGEYLTGNIEINGEKIGIVCFKRSIAKTNPKQPDWSILMVDPNYNRQVQEKEEAPEGEITNEESDDSPF